jgi:hypothetical protein
MPIASRIISKFGGINTALCLKECPPKVASTVEINTNEFTTDLPSKEATVLSQLDLSFL